MSNIVYHSDQIARFYQQNRVRWGEFYESERFIFERLAERFGPPRQILDAGCAAGGLGLALQERFGTVERYTGVDINPRVIELARARAQAWQNFLSGDVAVLEIPDEAFQWVVSLGCADWNLEPETTIRRLWEKVAPGGFLIISLRLTDQPGTCDPRMSYQYIDFFNEAEGREIANYVVFNVSEAIRLLATFGPELIIGFGYWGEPSRTAVTPYKRLAFTVFGLYRSLLPKVHCKPSRLEFDLPSDLISSLQPSMGHSTLGPASSQDSSQ